MKKLFAAILALAMVLSMASFAMADEPIEITIWHSWGSGANNEAMEELVAQGIVETGKTLNDQYFRLNPENATE